MNKSIKDTRESLSAEINKLKSNQAEIKNAIAEMQFQMNAVTPRMDEAEQRISDIDDKVMENSEAEKKGGNRGKRS